MAAEFPLQEKICVIVGGSAAIGSAALTVVAHFHYSTGCIIAIDGGRPLA